MDEDVLKALVDMLEVVAIAIENQLFVLDQSVLDRDVLG